MNNIFVYGTLVFDDIWNRIVKRRYKKQTALLTGYKRLLMRGKDYPGLIKSIGNTVSGVIYFNVSAQDIKRLDKFEGRYYRKAPVSVMSEASRKHKARTYHLDA